MTDLFGMRFPGRYIQGIGALERLREEVKIFGTKAAILLDNGLFDILESKVNNIFAKETFEVLQHGGECSDEEIKKFINKIKSSNSDVAIAIGGGKVLDTAKASACDIKVPVIIVPTIASTDAPCSALSVVYTPEGQFNYYKFLPRNPDLVLIDTSLIAQAPVRFLVAGIGDALATFYEADACRESNSNNFLGLKGLDLAFEIGRLCRDTLFKYSKEAIAECNSNKVGSSLEKIVEANTLLSGVGFESGGISSAHAIHNGLCELDEAHHFLHGEKVAIGILAGLKMRQNESEFDKVKKFCLDIGLPTKLSDIGIKEVTDEKLRIIARRACDKTDTIHNEPISINEDLVISALKTLI